MNDFGTKVLSFFVRRPPSIRAIFFALFWGISRFSNMSTVLNPTNGHHHAPSQSLFGQAGVFGRTLSDERLPPSANAISSPTKVSAVQHSMKAKTGGSSTTIPGKYVGIADLPNQVYRRVLKEGFKINLLILGEPGSGKSTLINSLFGVDVYSQNTLLPPSQRIGGSLQVHKNALLIEAKGVRVMANVLDVPNFGHFLDNSKSSHVLGQFIDQQLHDYFEASHHKRSQKRRVDGRIHCSLYLIPPTGHSLRPLDVSTMKTLGVRTNLIPIIGRADALTLEEREAFRQKVRMELKMNDVQVYCFPSDETETDETVNNKSQAEMENLVPFAVVGSNTFITGKDGVEVRVRKYPWGVLNVEDPRLSDLSILRRLLLFDHLPDLVGITDGLHYTNYVREFLSKMGPSNPRCVSRDRLPPERRGVDGPFASLEFEKVDSNECIAKLEGELQSIFDKKVQEKMRRLDESQRELEAKYAEWDDQLSARQTKLRQEREDYQHQKIVLIQAYPHLQDRLTQEIIRSGNANSRT